MNKFDLSYIGALLLLAVFIWVRDLSWISTADDTLPVLIALPLFFWLGAPWSLKDTSTFNLPTSWITSGIILFLLGILSNLNIFFALGWTALLWGWISTRIETQENPHLLKLMVLPLLAFPWITLDLTRVGWWIRMSGAWVAAQSYSLLGFSVEQTGTSLMISGLPFSVEAACGGLNTLQSLLIAGTMMNYFMLKEKAQFWWNLPLLVMMAWLANSLRILFLTAAALAFSPAFALGAFHTWGGWLILVTMFGLCWLIFSRQKI